MAVVLAAPDEEIIPLDKMFVLFAKVEDEKADGKKITLRKVDKWLKQANVINKQLTLTDTGVAFNKFKSKAIDFKEFEKFVEDLAKSKKMNLEDMKMMLMTCGPPGYNAPKPKEKRT